MIHYIFLVDYSYSMIEHLYKIVIVINNFISTLKSNNEFNDKFVSIASFSDGLSWIDKNTSVNLVKTITVNDFTSPGYTALYDSVCNVILEYGLYYEYEKKFYIISDGDDTHSKKYRRDDADTICQAAIACGNWEIKHFDTLDYQTLTVPKIQITMNDISSLLNNLKI